ncbi:hypothetical protein [Desulfovibrio falkowii]|uniref:Uncharacterized protein n=1 Tax=Desulfovibrio falkowii TaxID=3136602 RepID=A0ABQ0EB50_9BACT
MPPTPTQNILKLLEESLPPCFPRKLVHELTFGLVNPRTLANKDSEKTGPAGRFFVKREVWYQKDGFLEYVKTILKDSQASGASA